MTSGISGRIDGQGQPHRSHGEHCPMPSRRPSGFQNPRSQQHPPKAPRRDQERCQRSSGQSQPQVETNVLPNGLRRRHGHNPALGSRPPFRTGTIGQEQKRPTRQEKPCPGKERAKPEINLHPPLGPVSKSQLDHRKCRSPQNRTNQDPQRQWHARDPARLIGRFFHSGIIGGSCLSARVRCSEPKGTF